MALKSSQNMLAKRDGTLPSREIPILSETDIKEHLRVPAVQARLKRVRELVRARAQQKS